MPSPEEVKLRQEDDSKFVVKHAEVAATQNDPAEMVELRPFAPEECEAVKLSQKQYLALRKLAQTLGIPLLENPDTPHGPCVKLAGELNFLVEFVSLLRRGRGVSVHRVKPDRDSKMTIGHTRAITSRPFGGR